MRLAVINHTLPFRKAPYLLALHLPKQICAGAGGPSTSVSGRTQAQAECGGPQGSGGADAAEWWPRKRFKEHASYSDDSSKFHRWFGVDAFLTVRRAIRAGLQDQSGSWLHRRSASLCHPMVGIAPTGSGSHAVSHAAVAPVRLHSKRFAAIWKAVRQPAHPPHLCSLRRTRARPASPSVAPRPPRCAAPRRWPSQRPSRLAPPAPLQTAAPPQGSRACHSSRPCSRAARTRGRVSLSWAPRKCSLRRRSWTYPITTR